MTWIGCVACHWWRKERRKVSTWRTLALLAATRSTASLRSTQTSSRKPRQLMIVMFTFFTARCCMSIWPFRLSVCPSLCHTLAIYQKGLGLTLHHTFFITLSRHSSFLIMSKFRYCHPLEGGGIKYRFLWIFTIFDRYLIIDIIAVMHMHYISHKEASSEAITCKWYQICT